MADLFTISEIIKGGLAEIYYTNDGETCYHPKGCIILWGVGDIVPTKNNIIESFAVDVKGRHHVFTYNVGEPCERAEFQVYTALTKSSI